MTHDRYAAHRRRLQSARNRRIDDLAELVANGWTITAAARSMGLSQQAGSKMWKDIKSGLGSQAK